MNKKIYFRLLAFALLITSTLLIVANNIPYIGSFRWFWGPLALLSFIFLKSEILSHKMSFNILLYGVLFAGILQYSIWSFTNDWYKINILEDFYNFIIFVFLAVYLLSAREFVFWGRLAKWSLYFLIVTSIMTLIATQISPDLIRMSYSGSGDKLEGYSTLQKLGFGSYGFAISLVAIIPVLAFFIKSKSRFLFSKTVLWFLLGLVAFTLIQMQIFANILVGLYLMIFSFVKSKNRVKAFLLNSALLFIFIFTPVTSYVDTLTNISSLFSSDSEIYFKLNDMAKYLVNPNISDTGMGARSARYPELLTAFLAQPFFGDASYNSIFQKELESGGHLFWMSRLVLWGIFGFIGYLLILKNIFKPILNLFDKEYRYYYSLSLLSVFVLGLIKNLAGREIYIMLLIIIPGLYFYSKTKLELKIKRTK